MSDIDSNQPKPNASLLISLPFVRTFLERVGEAGVVIVDAEGEIVFASERAARLLGFSVPELEQQNYYDDIQLYNDRHEPFELWQRPDWNATHTENFTQVTPFFCWYKREQSQKHVVLKATQVSDGAQLFVIVELREAMRNLKVDEMKTLFISFAAHQLKTPSSIVKGFIELLLREGQKSFSAQQWDYIQSAHEANEQLIRLSRTLLNVTKLEGGMIEPSITTFDAQRTVSSKIKTHDLALEAKHIRVAVEGSGTVLCTSDEAIFSEIFDILLSNAIKFSPDNGRISVVVDVDNGEAVTVVVADQGSGIAPEQEQQLFSAFNASQVHTHNHGLGLMMAKKYLDLLGGSIGYERIAEGGSRFHFSVPKPI